MRSHCLQSEKVSHLLKGQYVVFSNVLVPGKRVYDKNKTKHYIDNHKTIKLADQFKSLYISILSQDALK